MPREACDRTLSAYARLRLWRHPHDESELLGVFSMPRSSKHLSSASFRGHKSARGGDRQRPAVSVTPQWAFVAGAEVDHEPE